MKNSGAISIAPYFLRLTLGIVIVWTGLGRVLDTFDVKGEQAAKLANMGVFIDKATAKTNAPSSPTTPAPTSPSGEAKPTVSRDHAIFLASYSAPATGQNFTAAEFPDPIPVMRVYSLALMLDTLGNDPIDAKKHPFHLWPKALSTGVWPLASAWACTATEVGCGTFLLVGFLTRFSAFILLFNMLVASWLTVVGPALQSGDTKLGFLPNYPTFSPEWQTFLIQFLLMGGLLAISFAGAGGLSIDRALFGGPTGSRPANESKPKAE